MWGGAQLPLYRQQTRFGTAAPTPGQHFGVTSRTPIGPRAPTGPYGQPLPAGTYNPERDLKITASGTGQEQLEQQDQTALTRNVDDYHTAVAELQQREGWQADDFAKAGALLSKQYATLAGNQEQGAAKAGVVSGGALLQSAAKRAANQTDDSGKQQTARDRQIAQNQQSRARLEREGAPPPIAGSLDPENLAQGGREFQNLATHLANARVNNAEFVRGEQSLEGQEAADHGYSPPAAPHAALIHAAVARPPRVVSSHAQPLSRASRRPRGRGGSAHPLLAAGRRRGR